MSTQITTIDQLKNIAEQGEIVELSPFNHEGKFVARMRRPALIKLAKNGKIPNRLLNTANTLFMNAISKEDLENDNFMSDIYEVVEILAEASFIEPTWEEIKESGIELTDAQYLDIFNYTQKGIESLDSFREDEESSGNN